MKNLTNPTIFCITLLALSACDNKTEINQLANDLSKQTEQSSEVSIKQQQKSIDSVSASQEDVNDDEEESQPLELIDFRNAIDSVVQDSIQEEVDKAVANEMTKNADKQK